jgi:hypothetical protein
MLETLGRHRERVEISSEADLQRLREWRDISLHKTSQDSFSPHNTFKWRTVGSVVMISDCGQRRRKNSPTAAGLC